MDAVDKSTSKCGSFKKGMSPFNKGIHICHRKEYTKKGHRGFLPRPIIVLDQDGSIRKRYASVKECAVGLGLKDRHAVTTACNSMSRLCRGYKLMYEEDWSPVADYHYKRKSGRDINGRCTDGILIKRAFKEMSDEKRKSVNEIHRQVALRLNANQNSNFGRYVNRFK